MLEEFWQERKEALGLPKISKQSNPTETRKNEAKQKAIAVVPYPGDAKISL